MKPFLKWVASVGTVVGLIVGLQQAAAAMNLPTRLFPWIWEFNDFVVLMSGETIYNTTGEISDLRRERYLVQGDIDAKIQAKEPVPKYMRQRIDDINDEIDQLKKKIETFEETRKRHQE